MNHDGLRPQVRQLVAALKVNSAMRLATRERTPTAAAATLADTVRHSPQRKATFLAEDGAVALIELLNSRKPDVSSFHRSRMLSFLLACTLTAALALCSVNPCKLHDGS